MEVGDEPRRKKIKPMSMGGAAVDAEDRRLTSCTIVEIVQPRSTDIGKVTRIGSWLEASLRSFNTLGSVFLSEVH